MLHLQHGGPAEVISMYQRGHNQASLFHHTLVPNRSHSQTPRRPVPHPYRPSSQSSSSHCEFWRLWSSAQQQTNRGRDESFPHRAWTKSTQEQCQKPYDKRCESKLPTGRKSDPMAPQMNDFIQLSHSEGFPPSLLLPSVKELLFLPVKGLLSLLLSFWTSDVTEFKRPFQAGFFVLTEERGSAVLFTLCPLLHLILLFT